MRVLSDWLKAYGESHQHPINRKIHTIAVPGTYLSVVGLIWSIPQLTIAGVQINWVWLALIPVWIFYFRLSLSVFMMMLGYTLACIGLIWSIEVLQLSFCIFPWFSLAYCGCCSILDTRLKVRSRRFMKT